MKTLLAMLILGAALVRAENPAHQFVVLLDVSQSMGVREAAAARKIRDLVRSGFQEQVMPGDLFDLWTFTSELKTDRFPTQLLNATNLPVAAELAGRFVEGQKFAGRTRFKSFADELNAWIARQPNALLFIVTDGEDAIVGLPNDLEINSYISPRKGPARTARRVFLIGFNVRNGRVVEWLAHDSLGPVQLPRLPARQPAPPPAAVIEEKPAAEPAKPVSEPPPPAVVDFPAGSVIVTPPPVAKAEEPPPKPVEQPAAAAVEQPRPAEPEPKPAAPAPAVVLAPAPVEPQPKAEEPVPAPSPAPVKTEPTVLEKPVPAESPTAESSTNQAVSPPVAVAAPGMQLKLYFVFGAGAVALLLALFSMRRSSGEKASLISKGLSRK